MNFIIARAVAIIKRVLGWGVFLTALLSTTISIINFIYRNCHGGEDIQAVIYDFVTVFVEMVRENTPFLDYFWTNSPVPTLDTGWSSNNLSFVIVFFLIFIGLALSASAIRLWQQINRTRDNLTSLESINRARLKEHAQKELETTQEMPFSFSALKSTVRIPYYTIFPHVFLVYFNPIITLVLFYYAALLLGFH